MNLPYSRSSCQDALFGWVNAGLGNQIIITKFDIDQFKYYIQYSGTNCGKAEKSGRDRSQVERWKYLREKAVYNIKQGPQDVLMQGLLLRNADVQLTPIGKHPSSVTFFIGGGGWAGASKGRVISNFYAEWRIHVFLGIKNCLVFFTFPYPEPVPKKFMIFIGCNFESRASQHVLFTWSAGLTKLKRVLEAWSAYHLNGIFGSFFWTNGTALFSTKETK